MSPSDPPVTEPDTAGENPDAPTPPAGRRKVVLVSVAAVVVLVVAGVVVFLLTRGDDDEPDTARQGRDVPTISDPAPPPGAPRATSSVAVPPPATATGEVEAEAGSPRSVADQAAAAISSADVDTLSRLSCDPAGATAEETFPTDAKAEVVGEPQISGDTATVNIRLTIGDSEPTTVPMPLTKKDGRWCVP